MPSSIYPFLETALTEFLARQVDQQMAWSPLVNRLLRAHEDGHAFIEIMDDLQDKALCSVNLSPEDVSEPLVYHCLLYTSPSPRDGLLSRMPSSA